MNHRTGNAAAERPGLIANIRRDLNFLRYDVEPDVMRAITGLQLGDIR